MSRGALKGALVGAGLLAAACAIVAPRPRVGERRRTWDYLRRFRYAHRGLYDPELGIPENSLPAFRRAARAGFGSELDVHLTADGGLVVVHDSWLERMTGEQVLVEQLSLDEVRRLRLGGTDEQIPLLSEVLEVYERLGAHLPLIVEVKPLLGNYAELTAATVEEIDRHGLTTCMESFDPRAVLWLARNRADVFRGQLAQNFIAPGQHSGHGRLFDVAATLLAGNALTRPDFIAYRFEDSRMPSSLLATALLRGAYVGWTLHSEEELVACERRGGIGIFEGFVPAAASSAYSND